MHTRFEFGIWMESSFRIWIGETAFGQTINTSTAVSYDQLNIINPDLIEGKKWCYSTRLASTTKVPGLGLDADQRCGIIQELNNQFFFLLNYQK